VGVNHVKKMTGNYNLKVYRNNDTILDLKLVSSEECINAFIDVIIEAPEYRKNLLLKYLKNLIENIYLPEDHDKKVRYFEANYNTDEQIKAIQEKMTEKTN
jgi:hypothetical protein